MSANGDFPARPADGPELGDFVILLLAGSLAGLRDRLASDGFDGPAELVSELVEIADDYLMRAAP